MSWYHLRSTPYLEQRVSTLHFNMWHEARKQERKIRGMLVDYRKRAERRQDFYEKIVSEHIQYCSNIKICKVMFCRFRKPIQRNLCKSTVENARYISIQP